MRHAAVAYLRGRRPHDPRTVPLTPDGVEQARWPAGARGRRGRPGDHERAGTDSRDRADRRAGAGAGVLAGVRGAPAGTARRHRKDGLEAAFAGAFAGRSRRTPGSSAARRSASSRPRHARVRGDRRRPGLGHALAVLGGVNRAILSYALTGKELLRRLRAGARVHQRPRRRPCGAMGRPRRQQRRASRRHSAPTNDDDGGVLRRVLRLDPVEERANELTELVPAPRASARDRCSVAGRAPHAASARQAAAVRHGHDAVELAVDDERRHVDALDLDADLPVAVRGLRLREPALRRCRRIEPRGDPPVVLLGCSSIQPGVNAVGTPPNCLLLGKLDRPHPDLDRVSGGGSWPGPPGPVPARTSDRTSSGRRASVSAM